MPTSNVCHAATHPSVPTAPSQPHLPGLATHLPSTDPVACGQLGVRSPLMKGRKVTPWQPGGSTEACTEGHDDEGQKVE